MFARQTCHDLNDARIFGTCEALDSFQQFHFGRCIERDHRVIGVIQRPRGAGLDRRGKLDATSTTTRNRTCRFCCVEQCTLGDFVGIGERGLVARDGAHTHTLINRKTTRLHDPFFKAPAFAFGELKVKIGVIHLVRENRAQRIQ